MAEQGTDAGFGPDRPARVARRRWPVMVAAILVVVAVVMAIHVLDEDRYLSRVEVVLAAPSASVALGADPSAVLLPPEEELALARSEQVRDDVVAAVGTEPAVEVSLDDTVVVVEATSLEPDRAAAAADAHVAAYLAHRAEVLTDRFVAALDQDPAGADGADISEAALRVLADFVASDQAALHDPAPVPSSPTRRPLLGDLLLAVLAGSVVGLLGVAAFERFDRTIRSRRDLARASGVPVLGTVPEAEHDRAGEDGDPLVEPAPGPTPVESIRALRVALDSALEAVSPPESSPPPAHGRVVGICGVGRGVGSTSVAVELAVVSASSGRRVVLVDADLRDPSAHQRFTDDPGPGLVGILRGDISLERAVHRPPGHPNLVVLASGSTDVGASDLLAGPRTASFVGSLAVQSDLVVVDMGPALECTETLALAPLADAIVVVAAVDRSDSLEVIDTITDLGTAGATVAGVVLARDPVTPRAPRTR